MGMVVEVIMGMDTTATAIIMDTDIMDIGMVIGGFCRI
jgi:hypothetical protein